MTIWIYVDGETGAPRKLNDDFFDIYGSATERKVSARLQLPNQAPDHASERAWPIRFVDLDVLGHVNNAAQWAPVEEVAHRTGMKLEGVRAQLEHGGETPPGSATIRWVGDASGFRTWLTTEAGTGSAAEVRPL